MVFRKIKDSDYYCDEPAGKKLAVDIINLLNKPENAETIRRVLLSKSKTNIAFLRTADFMLLPFTKKGDFVGSEIDGAKLGRDSIDAHNIAHGVLSLTHDDNVKKTVTSNQLKKLQCIADEITSIVNSAGNCRLKDLIKDNIEKQHSNNKSPQR